MPTDPPLLIDSPAAALIALLSRLPTVSHESIPLAAARGRFLAQPLHADRPSPALDVSVVDGFATRLADLVNGTIPIAGDALIGTPPITLAPSTAARIVTGAPIPIGADCVLRIEDLSVSSDSISFDTTIAQSLPPNRFIRVKGENARERAEFVPAGTLITPAVASALASCGVSLPLVYRRLRVGVLSTGDEVLPAHATPQPWQLRDGNTPTLHALFASLAFVDSIETRHTPDDPRRILAHASELLSRSDALFLTGGVSMGHRDMVPAALGQCGAATLFHKIPQRPGKPILAALGPRQQLILGLPGNPVSVLVTAHRFAVPALAHMAGLAAPRPQPAITIANPDGQMIPLWWHRIVRLTEEGQAELIDNKGSGDQFAAARSTGFVEIPPNTCGTGPWPYYGWTA